MRQALDAFQQALDGDGDTITPDFQFHLLIAQATENRYFADLMSHLGSAIIPRTRINSARFAQEGRAVYGARAAGTRGYLRRDPAPGRRSRPDRHAHAPRQQPRAPAPRAIERRKSAIPILRWVIRANTMSYNSGATARAVRPVATLANG